MGITYTTFQVQLPASRRPFYMMMPDPWQMTIDSSPVVRESTARLRFYAFGLLSFGNVSRGSAALTWSQLPIPCCTVARVPPWGDFSPDDPLVRLLRV